MCKIGQILSFFSVGFSLVVRNEIYIYIYIYNLNLVYSRVIALDVEIVRSTDFWATQ